MAVSSVETLTGPYATNGVTTTFPFTFKAMNEAEVRVFRIASTGVETTIGPGAYDVILTDNGGSVVFSVAPAEGDPLYIGSDPDFTQQITFENQGAFLPEVMNEAFDRAATRDLAIKRDLDRAIRVPLGEETAILPPITDRALKYLGFDADGIPVATDAVVDLAAAAALGIDAGQSDMGTTAGSILSDNGTAKDWFQESEEAIENRASKDLSNIANVDAVLSDDALTYPIGNELETYAQFNAFASDRRNDKREFIFNLSANFSRGPTGGGPYEYEDHKTLLYGGVNMHHDCRKAWVLNPLITIKPDCVDPEFVCNTEFDINNFSGRNFGDLDGAAGLPGPSAYGVMVAGSNDTGNRITGGYLLLNTPGEPVFNRGYIAGPNSVVQAAFDDYSSAASSYRDSGSHVIGVNLQGTYSSSAITVSGVAGAALNISGTKITASIFDSSTAPVGLYLNGTYATTPIYFGTLPRNFANDAAAAAGGIPVGGVYRNGSALMVRVA